jgi:hypothetical protein
MGFSRELVAAAGEATQAAATSARKRTSAPGIARRPQ